METVLFVLSRIGDGLLAFAVNLLTDPSLIEVVVPLVIVPLAYHFLPWLRERRSKELNELLHAAAGRATRMALIAAGVTTLEELGNPMVRAEVVAAASTYLEETMPKTLKRAGVKNDKTLADIITPHLPFPFDAIVGIGAEIIEGELAK